MRTNSPATWFRLYAEFATDPKVQMLSEIDQRRFVVIMCLRCCNGSVTLHDSEVAFQLRIPDQEWMVTKQTLLAKNLIDDDNKPIAWEKRQFDSDTSNARVAKHREKKKQQCNVTVTAKKRQSNGPETETETEKIKPKSKAESALATRLPADWTPSQLEYEFCVKERPDLSPNDVADRFRDYWVAVPGAKGRKIDWVATWRNWVRNERGGSNHGKNGSSRADRVSATIAELTGANRHPAPAIDGVAARVD